MQPTIGYEVLMALQAIALSQVCQLTIAQSLAQLGLSAAVGRLPYPRLTEQRAALAIAAEVWKELKFVDGGAIAPSQIEVS